METWIYFIHPPRVDFAETMTDAESEAWERHWARIKRLYDEGVHGDPAIAEGIAQGELRPMRVSLLRGRDEARIHAELEASG